MRWCDGSLSRILSLSNILLICFLGGADGNRTHVLKVTELHPLRKELFDSKLFIMWGGIPKRLIEGVKRQQLRSTILPYLHSRIPNYWLMQPEVLLQCNLINIVGSTMWSTLATHLPSLCLSGLFPLSDPWDSSQSPSHRQSTFEPCVLQCVP